jgi:predicted RNase H-like HicB family nuclease
VIGDKGETDLKKYVFWSVLNQHTNVALTEDLSKYAQGDTFWRAMLNLSETLREWVPSERPEETDINSRLKMYNETGINKVELFVEKEKDRYAVRCTNSRSFLRADSEENALIQYIAARAKTSVVNTGEPPA